MNERGDAEQTASVCRDFLESPPAAAVGDALASAGITSDGIVEAVRQYVRTRVWPEALARVLSSLREDTGLREGYVPERYLLTHAALGSMPKLSEARIAPDVETLMRREYEFFARPNPNWLATFESGSRTSVAYAGMAVLKRFTAGQSHWEVSGLPRSWLLKAPLRDQPRILGTILRMGGFAPCYYQHIMPPRSNPPFLLERRSLRSWFLIAQSMEMQPEIRGIITASWLNSEDTLRISPHLRWMNDVIVNNGGILTHLGLAREDSGFLVGSPERQRLYEAGEYRPREGLFIWPRDAMLRWLAECRAGKHKI
ncbi:MAG TPA: hypothetical protein VG297_23925 [Bryobacteraceae bacterium]|nr:hypothetical protein [Bryobacteraceae bacterium]